MSTREPCATDEWYHCYNRGTDKRIVFNNTSDYERFLTLLYVSNGTKSIRISDTYRPSLKKFLNEQELDRGAQLVEIGAYALMPNHQHIVLKQLEDSGIARFMQKVFTGYTMYFNLKYARTGALFAGTYKAVHIDNDRYLKQVISYVLLNPAELFEPRWKEKLTNTKALEEKILGYRYSSLADFFGSERAERKIINADLSDYYGTLPKLERMLADASKYDSPF